jgi:hypothetical protein
MAYPFEKSTVLEIDRKSTEDADAPSFGRVDSAVAVLAAATKAVIKTSGLRRRSFPGMKLLLESIGFPTPYPRVGTATPRCGGGRAAT